MRIKICGITNIEDALLCTALGADAIGFVFYRKSKRYVEIEKAAEISAALPPFVNKVGVFVDETPVKTNSISRSVGLTNIQLSEKESAQSQLYTLPIIPVFRVDKNFDYSRIYNSQSNNILLDVYDKHYYGGTGKSFEWFSIPSDLRKRIILAGGISIENIEKIFCEIRPAAVDLSSSLEECPGKKDHNKVKHFFEKINKLRGNKC